jgi:26S proteasome regulatory subunit N11
MRGLNRGYYSIAVHYKKDDLEQTMLNNHYKISWVNTMKLTSYDELEENNEKTLDSMCKLVKTYHKVTIPSYFLPSLTHS